MVDYLLLAGRLVLVFILYLFLFAVMRTGIGLVKGQNKKAKTWKLVIDGGPKTLKGLKIEVTGPVIAGRAPGCDITVPTDYVSARHARFFLMGSSLMVEDLGSTNGTSLNGSRIQQPTACSAGDTVTIGNVDIKIGRS